MTLLLGGTFLLGLYLAWSIGANDFANSMGDAVGSRALSVRRAVILGGLCEIAGSMLAGAHVSKTLRCGIVDPSHFAAAPELFALGMLGALLGTGLWLNLASWFGLPVSTTHAVVGGVAGFGLVGAGFAAVSWGKLGSIVASWFISPLVGGILGWTFFRLMTHAILGRERPIASARRAAPVVVFIVVAMVTFSILFKGVGSVVKGTPLEATRGSGVAASVALGALAAILTRPVLIRRLWASESLPLGQQLAQIERVFAPLVVLTSCSVAFAHGANDVANAIGPVAAILDIMRAGTVDVTTTAPTWLLGLGGIGIVIGLATYGYRVMRTIGTKITQLTPTRGVAADLAAALTVISCTLLRLPVSTTHTIVGAIIGVGFARGLGAVNRRVTQDIFGSWLLTVPACAALSAGFFLLGRSVGLGEVIRASFRG